MNRQYIDGTTGVLGIGNHDHPERMPPITGLGIGPVTAVRNHGLSGNNNLNSSQVIRTNLAGLMFPLSVPIADQQNLSAHQVTVF